MLCYEMNPRTLEELKRHIPDEINITRELQRVMGNSIKGCQNVSTTKVDSSSTSVNKSKIVAVMYVVV